MITYNKFRKEFIEFLQNANVNLGRKTSKTREIFIEEVCKRIDRFFATVIDSCEEKIVESKQAGLRPDSIKVLRPEDRQRALDIGQGVHAMTANESMRADEQLNRSPFAGRKEGDSNNDQE